MIESDQPIVTQNLAPSRHEAHLATMTKRATTRPATFQKPAHWEDTPVPQPEEAKEVEDPDGLNPTRYGDWVKSGIAVDF